MHRGEEKRDIRHEGIVQKFLKFLSYQERMLYRKVSASVLSLTTLTPDTDEAADSDVFYFSIERAIEVSKPNSQFGSMLRSMCVAPTSVMIQL